MSKALGILLVIVLGIFAAFGWLMNIIKLISAEVLGEIVLRGIGVFVSPIGAIAGYF